MYRISDKNQKVKTTVHGKYTARICSGCLHGTNLKRQIRRDHWGLSLIQIQIPMRCYLAASQINWNLSIQAVILFGTITFRKFKSHFDNTYFGEGTLSKICQ